MVNIQSILDCPTPNNVTILRGFVGICTYYTKFVKGFSQLTTPLTNITKKGAFYWTKESEKSFKKMKEVIRNCLFLASLYFTQPFVLECDVSDEGVGVFLM